MDKEELNAAIRKLVQTPDRMQEFADLASPETNWAQIDKRISIPRNTGMAELDCPSCFDSIRLIFDEFAGHDLEIPLICPLCQSDLVCKSQFTGYTNEITLDEC